MPKKGKLVLAYSGGLDTSVILVWLKKKGYDVVTYTADVGQPGINLEKIKRKALKTGASEAFVYDLKEEFVTNYIFPAIRANATYEGRYLLGTSLARPLIAQKQVELAKEIGANILSHGSTGKGNDQVRFELAYLTLAPECKIYAPWKEQDFLRKFKKGRDDLIAFARKNKIHIDQSKKNPWSNDDNLMHISYEAGILENPNTRPPERMFKITKSPQKAPNKETIFGIKFNEGNPVAVVDSKNKYFLCASDPLNIVKYLNKVAGENGVGRLDMVESRYVGMKSRGVYETPAGTLLHVAHEDLEALTLDREIIKMNQHTSIDLGERIYSGHWFSPEREAMQKSIDATQKFVTGQVNLALYKGNVTIIGRTSPCSLYDEGIASMHEAGNYDPTKARGFIDINAGRLQASEKRNKKISGELTTTKI